MIPYSSLYFFYIMLLALVPAVILGLCQKPIKVYGLIVTLFMLYILFGDSRMQIACIILFYLGELILVKGYVYIRSKTESRWLMRFIVLLSISPLILVKTSHFFTNRVIGFLGVSYLTFKAVQMIIEIYDGLIKKINILDFTYYLLFFPTISSGPIDRSRRFNENINRVLPRSQYVEMLGEGITKLLQGVGYKFIIAALIDNYWIKAIPAGHSFLNTLSYMYAYSFYLFFDFAGYSLIAIGTSYILGIKTPENFNKPFISKDIKDFWNRWHMTLSFWFRDFIYTRFVMQSLKKKRFKSKYTASYIGFIITMLTMGIWHGLQMHYIIYGLYHGLLIVSTDYFQRKSKVYKKYKNNRWWNYASIAVTFNLVCFGLLLFSGYLIAK